MEAGIHRSEPPAFNKPIYRTLYESDDGTHGSHWMIDGVSRTTKMIPSDWASHTGEGVEQHAYKDIEYLRKNNGPLLPKLTLREPDVYCMRWSYLRPFIYICDGRNIYGYKTDVSGRQVLPKRNFTINVNEDQLFDDPMVDVIVVNERNHELLVSRRC
uniref:DUF4912 domain-containing protein n=1 Tax=Panagrellus redivivus TaxID=6233 RepID=A0A7E4WAZ5_PANRE